MAILTVNGLSKSFGALKVLENIDFSIDRGEVVAIIGPSGSGKTTLLRCISYLERADAGQMQFGEMFADMKHISDREIKELRKNLGFVFQSFNLFKNKTALENVMEGLTVARKVPKQEARKRAMEMLAKVGMENRASHYPDELSGGQQQRVAIARAIALDPQVILFDEPTSALDPELTREVLEVMRKLANEGTTMVVVTHEMSFARDVASRVVFMEDGQIVEQGSAKQIFENPMEERTRLFIQQ